MKLNVLLFGSGAREHALAEKIASSSLLNKLYLANAGSAFLDKGEIIEFQDFEELAQKAKEKNVDLVVVGPEKPLVEGICDVFQKNGIRVFGANGYWAQLEGSKIFAKDFMQRNDIKTAKYIAVADKNSFNFAFSEFDGIPVVKADGLKGGKGVFVCESVSEAKTKWQEPKMLLEERLFGRELSVFSFWDGKTLLSLPPAGDFKKLCDGDIGPNTGGMGAVFPISANSYGLKSYLRSLKNALLKEKANFCGLIYSGLMEQKNGQMYVLEFNMRFGDPEIQAVLQNLKTDLLQILWAAACGTLDEIEIKISKDPSYCVVLASNGYPDKLKSGAEIFNIEEAKNKYGVKIYFAGVKKIDNRYFVDGGRVLSVCKSGVNAKNDVYNAASKISFEGKIYRKDIDMR